MTSEAERQCARDARFMDGALAIGRRWLGTTAPNPAVGALVVREGVIVGHGATRPGGRPHAETEALRQAGAAARGATLYVTLEPCSHYGRTPPCVEAILAAGVARVVSAIDDPDPRVAGQGHRRLREAGLAVAVGCRARQARCAHLGHILRTLAGRPAVALKMAETRDGFAAGMPGEARLLITSEAANRAIQMMRATHDAILVGAETALADDPLLTVRLAGLENRKPLRVVLDSSARLSPASRLAATAAEWPTLVLTGRGAPAGALDALARAGVATQESPMGPDGLDLAAALGALARRGLTRVLVEGGPRLASALIGQRLADSVTIFRSPRALDRPGLKSLSSAARRALESEDGPYRRVDAGRAGDDEWRLFERTDECSPDLSATAAK